MVLAVLSIYWATFAHGYGWVEYGVNGWYSLAFQLNFLWAFVVFVLAYRVIGPGLRLRQQRQDDHFSDRFSGRLPIQVRPRGETGRLEERQIAFTEDLDPSGLSFRSLKPLDVGAQLALTLPLSAREVSVTGRVVRAGRDPTADVPVFVHEIDFDDVSLDVRDAIRIHRARHTASAEEIQFGRTGDLFSRTRDWLRNARGARRRRVRLPTWVLVGAGDDPRETRESMAFLEEISAGGARLIMSEPVAPGTPLLYEVPGTGLRGEGFTVFSRALETPIGVRFAVGMRREPGIETDSSTNGPLELGELGRDAIALALLFASAASSRAALV